MKKKWMPMVIWLTAAAVVVIAVIVALNNLWGDKPVKTVTASEVAENEIEIPRGNKGGSKPAKENVVAIEILMDSTGVVNLSLFPDNTSAAGDSMRLSVIKAAISQYADITGTKVNITIADAKRLMNQPLVNYSLAHPGVASTSGVPTVKIAEDSYSQLQVWVMALNKVNNPLVQQSMKNGTGIIFNSSIDTKYTDAYVVLEQLKEIDFNRFTVMTHLKSEEVNSTLTVE